MAMSEEGLDMLAVLPSLDPLYSRGQFEGWVCTTNRSLVHRSLLGLRMELPQDTLGVGIDPVLAAKVDNSFFQRTRVAVWRHEAMRRRHAMRHVARMGWWPHLRMPHLHLGSRLWHRIAPTTSDRVAPSTSDCLWF